MRRDLAVLFLALLTCRHLAGAPTLSACAPAPRPGETVVVADEEALVAYDPVTGVEHFIRRAAFRTGASEFGFLVPTPTLPELAEAPDWIFSRITARIAPRVEHRTRIRGVTVASCCLAPLMLTRRDAQRASTATPVEVLSTQRVAGYDAVALRADDPAALAGWLSSHGYADGPDLREWLSPYIAARWVLTAFRVAKPDPRDPRPPGTSNVRMSFETPRAVYPYREPASQRMEPAPQRRLRVHVLGPKRVEGQLGERGPHFPGRATYARPSEDWESLLAGALPAGALRGRLWLTSFDDTSSPRPGTDDVWFSPMNEEVELTPPTVVQWTDDPVPIPLDLLMVLGAGASWLIRRRRRLTLR